MVGMNMSAAQAQAAESQCKGCLVLEPCLSGFTGYSPTMNTTTGKWITPKGGEASLLRMNLEITDKETAVPRSDDIAVSTAPDGTKFLQVGWTKGFPVSNAAGFYTGALKSL